jgi:hypothetical protein
MTHAARVHAAVNNDDWQKVRLSMKGLPTEEKIDVLIDYYEADNFSNHTLQSPAEWEVSHDIVQCDVCIRIDNYIKALCRGGQLQPGVGIDNLSALGRSVHG